MSTKMYIMVLATVLSFFLVYLVSGLIMHKTFVTVKPGQVWGYETDNKNPFKKPISYKYEVLDVKGGYVKYRHIDKDSNTSSDMTDFFKMHSHLIAEKENDNIYFTWDKRRRYPMHYANGGKDMMVALPCGDGINANMTKKSAEYEMSIPDIGMAYCRKDIMEFITKRDKH